jgi:hypothetical protein
MKTIFVIVAVALLSSCQKELKSIPASLFHPRGVDSTATGELDFTTNNTNYKFKDSSIAVKTYVGGDSLNHIFIEVKEAPYDYQINIIGTSTGIVPGTYPFIMSNVFLPNTAMFRQQKEDYVVIQQDFSLQVISYQNGILNGTFHSSGVSNGIINNIKVN